MAQQGLSGSASVGSWRGVMKGQVAHCYHLVRISRFIERPHGRMVGWQRKERINRENLFHLGERSHLMASISKLKINVSHIRKAEASLREKSSIVVCQCKQYATR